MTTVRKLFNDLGITNSILPFFLCDVEILINYEHTSQEDYRNYFYSNTFKKDITSIVYKLNMFNEYYGHDVKYVAFFPDKYADLHLDVFPLVF